MNRDLFLFLLLFLFTLTAGTVNLAGDANMMNQIKSITSVHCEEGVGEIKNEGAESGITFQVELPLLLHFTILNSSTS